MAAVAETVEQDSHRLPAEVLFAVAQELAALGRTGAMLQELIANKAREGELSGMAFVDAQAADLLVQHLTELAKFLETYAEGINANARDPLAAALDNVLLSALSRRLASPRAEDSPAPAPGDLDMF